MTMKEKLVELLREAPYNIHGNKLGNCYFDSCLELIANSLIAHGVTVQDATDTNVRSKEWGDGFKQGYEDGCKVGFDADKWISVKDRLPQDDLPFGAMCEIVQVLLDDGTVTVGWCNRGLKCWYYMPINAANFVGHDYENTPVVAWQPLAQPPKGE